MKINNSSYNLIVKLSGCWDGNAHRSGGPDEITGREETQKAVGRLLGEAVGRELRQAGDGVASSLQEALAGVLAWVKLSVSVWSAFVGEVCWF